MAEVRVTGGSDDLIEIEGDIYEEFNPSEPREPHYLAFSDGTVLSVVYDKTGIWRVNRVVAGTSEYSKVDGSEAEDTFDVVTLKGDIRWCVFGSQFEKAKPAPAEVG